MLANNYDLLCRYASPVTIEEVEAFERDIKAQLEGHDVPLMLTGHEGASTSSELHVVARPRPALRPPSVDDAVTGADIARLMR